MGYIWGEDFRKFWKAVKPPTKHAIVTMACFLEQENQIEFRREDFEALHWFVPKNVTKPKQNQLTRLAKEGYLERKRQGVYALTDKGRAVVQDCRSRNSGSRNGSENGSQNGSLAGSLNGRSKRAQGKASKSKDMAQRGLSLKGISRFLRTVPSATLRVKVLLSAYFLRRYCGVIDFNKSDISACFQRTRGLTVPSSLSTILSQVLLRREGVLTSADKRGHYRMTNICYQTLREKRFVQEAEARLEGVREPLTSNDFVEEGPRPSARAG